MSVDDVRMGDDRRRDTESGRFDEEVSDAELLAAIHAAGGVAPTREIAERVAVSPKQVRERLHVLVDAGDDRLERIDAGRKYVWQLVD